MAIDKTITLREGLKKFREENHAYLSHGKEGISIEAKTFFESHDIAHVLFDCDISLYGEGAVKIWTIFGTTLGFWNHFGAYKDANAYDLAKEFKLVDILNHIFKLLYNIPTLVIRAKRMTRPWPWSAFDTYLDMPIHVIREEFNIKVA